jgi:uncharacterized repeat protein (TIGR03803 family)
MKTRIKQWFLLPALVAGLSLIPAGRVSAQTFTKLFSFTGVGYNASEVATNSEGGEPYGGLLLSGSTLYGTAQYGGTNGEGTVFAINTDGTDFTNLHTFAKIVANASNFGTNSDGANPYDELILSGNTLYGTTETGGTNGSGTVFAVNTNGSGFTVVHTFTALSARFGGTNGDGANPWGGLLLSGGTLYGTTYGGGTNGNGTVFAVNTSGTVFTVLHTFTETVADASFAATNSDGANPEAGLILSGATLYGTTYGGGTNGDGTVFAVNTDGSGYTRLHSFAGSPSDGAQPTAGLFLADGTLYGTAESGGSGLGQGSGTVFAINTNGSDYMILHYLNGTSDGAYPYAGLVLSGNTLFGTAAYDGSGDDGTVFACFISGTNSVYSVLHTFTAYNYTTDTNSDGAFPYGGVILSGNTLYGTAYNGGNDSYGTVFSISLPMPPLTITPSGANLVVTWPTNVLVFTLQSTTSLVPPVVWTTVSPPPYAVIGTNNVVTTAISGTPQFFRLSL